MRFPTMQAKGSMAHYERVSARHKPRLVCADTRPAKNQVAEPTLFSRALRNSNSRLGRCTESATRTQRSGEMIAGAQSHGGGFRETADITRARSAIEAAGTASCRIQPGYRLLALAQH